MIPPQITYSIINTCFLRLLILREKKKGAPRRARKVLVLLYCHTKHLISCYLIFIFISAYRTKCYKSFVFDVLLGAYQIIQHKHTSINKVQGGIQGRSQSIEQLFRGMSTDTKIPSEINRTKNARTAHSATTFTTKYQHLLVAKKRLNLH